VNLSDISRPVIERMLRNMLQIRAFEEALYRSFMSEKMPGTMHQTNGQEAIAVGVGANLRHGDVMTSTHRGHGHAIVKGVSINALMAEMYGRKTGISLGMGGSMHLFDLGSGFLGTTGVVGAGVPIAVGAGLALQLEGNGAVAIAFMGDGAMNQGAVHEALNLAAVWKLPVIFVCENNGYAVSYPANKAFAIHRIAERAAGYGMPGTTVDGNDVAAVYIAAQEAIDRARSGSGPSLIEGVTYRQRGHSRFEPGAYRPEGELERWKTRDPVDLFQAALQKEGRMEKEEIDAMKVAVEEEIQTALRFAKTSPMPSVNDALGLVFEGE
jgi:TPP-dependent pyruvate/acetoin dehydrogenase alpha subunit